MFDIAWTEMLLLVVVTILVVGPRDLPKVMKAIGNVIARARALAGKFQADMDQLAREAELDELRKQARAYEAKLRAPQRDLQTFIDPLADEEPRPSSSSQGTAAEAAPAPESAPASAEKEAGGG